MSMSGRSGVVFSVCEACAGERSESGDEGARPSGKAEGIEGRPLEGGGDDGCRLSGAGADGAEAGGPGRGIGGLGRGGSAMAAMIIDSAADHVRRSAREMQGPCLAANDG